MKVITKISKEIESINNLQDIRITAKMLEEVEERTKRDKVLQELIQVIQTGWPERKADVAHQIALYEAIAVRGERVVIPFSLRKEMKSRVHYAHSGVFSTYPKPENLCIGLE